jgi:hypothetical protein
MVAAAPLSVVAAASLSSSGADAGRVYAGGTPNFNEAGSSSRMYAGGTPTFSEAVGNGGRVYAGGTPLFSESDAQLSQLIQAMAQFSANSGGSALSPTSDQAPNDAQALLTAYWQPAA